VLLEHITLSCADVEGLAGFLSDRLGLRLSESVRHEDGSWFNAFMRVRDRHHDLAFFGNDEGDEAPGLNHVCFAVPSVEGLIRVADLAVQHGIFLDASPGRHLAGDNIFIYLKDPDGNRVEVNTDMAWIDPVAAPRVLTEMRFDAWRESIPPTMLTSSPCRDGRVPATATRHARG
jgi:catechol 2,3-dioxygenase-like lactoylglutathione lyase family enzyme